MGKGKTKTLISCAVSAQLICVFVFRICKKPVFSHRGSIDHQWSSHTVFSTAEGKCQNADFVFLVF